MFAFIVIDYKIRWILGFIALFSDYIRFIRVLWGLSVTFVGGVEALAFETFV